MAGQLCAQHGVNADLPLQPGWPASAACSSLRSHGHRWEIITVSEAVTSLPKSICGYTVISIHTTEGSCVGISIVMFPTACFLEEKMRLLKNPWIPQLVQLLQAHTRRQMGFWHLFSLWWDPYQSRRSGVCLALRVTEGSSTFGGLLPLRMVGALTEAAMLPSLHTLCSMGLAPHPGLTAPPGSQSWLEFPLFSKQRKVPSQATHCSGQVFSTEGA